MPRSSSAALISIATACLTDDDRHDRALALERRQSSRRERRRASPRCCRAARATSCGRSRSSASARRALAATVGRQAVGEELRPRALLEHRAEGLAAGDEASGRPAERLAQRPCEDQLGLAEQAEALGTCRVRSRRSPRCRASRRRRGRRHARARLRAGRRVGARSPSMLKTPSVTIRRRSNCRCVASSFARRSPTSACS